MHLNSVGTANNTSLKTKKMVSKINVRYVNLHQLTGRSLAVTETYSYNLRLICEWYIRNSDWDVLDSQP